MQNFRQFVIKLIEDNNYKSIAEVGVWKGELSQMIIKTKPKKLYLIDPLKVEWNDMGTYKCTMGLPLANQDELDKIAKDLKKLDAVFIRKPSHEAVKKIKDKSLDFVFIDAVHTYEHVKNDIKLWLPKIKKGGMIAGDDYKGKYQGDVQKAVKELLPKHNDYLKVWYKQL